MWSIHKFGGTCVGTSERIQKVAEIIVNDSSEGKVVVVSAMSKVTDMMYNLINKAQSRDDSYIAALDDVLEKHKLTAHELLEGNDLLKFISRLHDDIGNLKAMLRAIYIAGHATESFSDFVAGHGELWSAQILSAVVRKLGVDCNWMDTREVIIVNPTSANQVDPDLEVSERSLEEWYSKNPSKTIIATGFIANGSDFSAAIMGALFRARQVTIWTDVDGVYSADPRKVSEAVILNTLSYQEAWEMQLSFNLYCNAVVLWGKCFTPPHHYTCYALRHPYCYTKYLQLSAPGTIICRPPSDENGDIQDFGTVKDVGANVIMISQASSEHSVCFAVPENEVKAVADALESRFSQALGAGRLSKHSGCGWPKMASTPGVSASLFNALAKANINIRAIAQGCSEYNITVVLKREDCIRALRAVHSRFYLSKTTIAMGIVGPGLIGATLLDQLRDQAAVLKEKFNIDLRVMGITGSKKMVLSDLGIDLAQWREELKEKAEEANMEKFTQHVHGNHFIPNTALVDCTADEKIASHYLGWLRKGIHVITPNKKANSGPLDQYLKLRALQRQSYTHYFYEATVGAGLPIISTLRGLLETGDKILRVEGIFSGTLSYIFNNFIEDRAFSEVVTEAKNAGYTEPDPRDDLSGMDVARKPPIRRWDDLWIETFVATSSLSLFTDNQVIILARESGLRLELSDIQVDSLVPEPLKSSASAEEFLRCLPEFDQEIAKKRLDAETAGEVLRYVGVVDAVQNKGFVELRRYKKEHPFAQLSGSDNIIAFTTTRYKEEQPLIVRGPGAGAEVTAGGIFCDLLRLASYLGAPS
ncbi:hypothetical protein MKW92_048967 [Papaver armeniacum]|nr:hypothetical protein MKW92_048967 [Papaver armeniacum]